MCEAEQWEEKHEARRAKSLESSLSVAVGSPIAVITRAGAGHACAFQSRPRSLARWFELAIQGEDAGAWAWEGRIRFMMRSVRV